jgi:hypothetical protein
MSPGEKGRSLLQAALDDYNSKSQPATSGVILLRRDQLVVDGSYKWVPCVWTFRDKELVLVPATAVAAGDEHFEEVYPIQSDTQYKKPKSKHYPLQFGVATHVYTSVLLDTVTYMPSGYAPTPLDNAQTRAGTTAVHGTCKLASLELKDLEKILVCIQAVVEGKNAGAYLADAGY